MLYVVQARTVLVVDSQQDRARQGTSAGRAILGRVRPRQAYQALGRAHPDTTVQRDLQCQRYVRTEHSGQIRVLDLHKNALLAHRGTCAEKETRCRRRAHRDISVQRLV